MRDVVTASKTNGAARARALSPYFDIQLQFAFCLAERGHLAVAEAVALFTNLHRRFGYGKIAVQGLDNRWQIYIDGLCKQPDAEARLAFTVDWYARAATEPAPAAAFGCFNFDPPDGDGVVRLHFNPVDKAGGVGPLHVSKSAARRAEVRQMARHICTAHPDAQRLRGMSWLYNLEAYRRVFPTTLHPSSRAAYDTKVYRPGDSSSTIAETSKVSWWRGLARGCPRSIRAPFGGYSRCRRGARRRRSRPSWIRRSWSQSCPSSGL